MTDARLQREAEFHNQTFADGSRVAAGKFYTVAATAKRRYHALIDEVDAGQRVLEYGCGKGSYAFDLARRGVAVVGIDISEEGIHQATERACAEGLDDKLSFKVMNAEALEFPADHFDLVCGSGILHHLDLDAALRELARVLKPGGRAAFFEPLGHNLLINLYRRLTPKMRSADEHPLLVKDFDILAAHFDQTHIDYYALCALMAVPFRSGPGFKLLLKMLEGIDAALLRLPLVKRQAWLVVIALQGPRAG